MTPVQAYYLREHAQGPIILTSPVDVESLIERVRPDEELAAPPLVNLYLVDDPHDRMLAIGVQKDRGVVRYASREWPGGVTSTNGEQRREGTIPYSFQDHPHEFHTNSEVSLDLVREAVNQYMETDGARPTCIRWQLDVFAELMQATDADSESS